MSSPQRQKIYIQYDSLTAAGLPTPGGIQRPTAPTRSLGKEALRDRTCSECLRTIPTANVLRCTGCKIALYCNRDCQKANWDNHKKVCGAVPGLRNQWDEDHKLVIDHLAQLDPNASKKELREREHRLARSWFDGHQLSIHKAAIAAMQECMHSSDLRAFPFYGQCVFFLAIRPRRDMGDSPATAFYLASAGLRPVVDAAELARLGIAGGLADKAREFAAWARDHGAASRYLAFVPVVCTYTALSFYHCAPVYAPSPRAAAVLQARGAQAEARGRWLAALKAMVLRGHMLGPPPMDLSEVDVGAKVGEMIKIGPMYGWTALDPEEAKRLGYPEYPGVVG